MAREEEPRERPATGSRRTDLATLLAYLAAIAVAEILSASGNTNAGLGLHLAVMFALLFHASGLSQSRPGLSRLLAGLLLAPLLRVLSMSVPFWPFSMLQWLGIMSLPLLAACVAVQRSLRLNAKEVGLSFGPLRGIPWQVLVALAGVPLGVLEFLILSPDSWLDNYEAARVAFAVLAIFAATGLAEELIFRGILQRLAGDVLGRAGGLLYVNAVFASLHFGFLSPLDVAFAFLVGLLFGYVVLRTKSLVGVALAHTLINVMLYLVVPAL